MTFILAKAGKKLFERHLEQYAPQDPLYEFYSNEKGKQKRRKVRAIRIEPPFYELIYDSALFLLDFVSVMPRSSGRSSGGHTISIRGFTFAGFGSDGRSSSGSFQSSEIS